MNRSNVVVVSTRDRSLWTTTVQAHTNPRVSRAYLSHIHQRDWWLLWRWRWRSRYRGAQI